MARAAAIILAALVLAGSVAFVFRWQIAADGTTVYLLDRWTGKVTACRQAILGRDMDCF